MTLTQKIACALAALGLTIAAIVGTIVGSTTVTHPGAVGYGLNLPTTTETQTQTTTEAEAPAIELEPVDDTDLNEMAYLDVVTAKLPNHTDTELINTGRAVCTVLDDTTAPTIDTLIGIGFGLIERFGWTTEQAGTVNGAAVMAFCPTYGYLIT